MWGREAISSNTPHTLDNSRTEFFVDSIFQSLTYEQWSAAGRKKAVHLAHEKALQLIDAYVERHWVR